MKLSSNRRSGEDRRKSKQPPKFPLHDSNGTLVFQERRQPVDRRTEGIELTVSDMPKEEFEEYFKDFQEKLNT